MGTITLALENNKLLLAIPRRRKFEALGHVLVALTMEEIPGKIVL
jgi:hypothetical protein